MYVLEIGLFLAGALLLLYGYRRNSRNAMLLAAVALLLSGTVADFASGFSDGASAAHASNGPDR